MWIIDEISRVRFELALKLAVNNKRSDLLTYNQKARPKQRNFDNKDETKVNLSKF